MKIDTPLARLYNVAEYFFGNEASEHLDIVNDAIDHVYCNHDDADVREAFKRYLECKETLYFSTGICEMLTAGFGGCDEYGYFKYPLPAKFIDQFLVEKK